MNDLKWPSQRLQLALDDLKRELTQAIRRGDILGKFTWTGAIELPGRDPHIVLLTVAEIGEERKAA